MTTVESLFPGAAVRLRHGRRLGPTPVRPARDAEQIELAVVPDAARARLLVPAGRRAPMKALARYSYALGARETLERIAAGAATGLAGTGVLPNALIIERTGGDDIVSVLGELLGHPVQVSLGVGTVRANRKPVLGVMDDRGRLVAYAKIGDDAVARDHVRGEATALRGIAGVDWREIAVPRLLAEHDWNDLLVVVMSALSTAPMLPARNPARAPEPAMAEIAGAFDEGWMELAATPLLRRLRERAAGLARPVAAGALSDALEQVLERHGDRRVRVGAWHGDFAPWNVASRRGRLAVWDWERFETGVPEGLDRAHWTLNVRTRTRGFDTATVRAAIDESRRLAPAGAGRGRLPGEVHLAALATRYLAAAERPGGEAIAERAEVALDALAAEVGLEPSTGPRGVSCRDSVD